MTGEVKFGENRAPRYGRAGTVRATEGGKVVIELHKFIVASEEKDAVTTLSVWNTHPEIRAGLSDKVFEDREAAERQCADLIQRAKDESPFGCGVPCDEHSRCVGFDPKVWEVRLSVSLAT